MQQVTVLEGCDAFELGDGPTGCLFLHGFTSSPQVLRSLGQHLADRGIAVSAPRLPGHGTTWQDLATHDATQWVDAADEAFEKLEAATEEAFVLGFSFGGAVALDLASRYRGRVAGLVLLAPFLGSKDPRRFLSPVIRRVVRTLPWGGNDTADPDAEREIVYERVPTGAVHRMLTYVKTVHRKLPQVDVPVLILHGRNDHTAPPVYAQLAYERVSSRDKELVWLDRSYHILPFDYDREEVFRRTYEFIAARSAIGVASG